jgi:hypothetical protein
MLKLSAKLQILEMRRLFLLGLTLLVATGCAPKQPNAATVTPPSSANGPSSIVSCTTALVDSGQKGSSASVGRGAYSDVKIIPGTSSPAMAFTDVSAVSLKFNYWNGTQFVDEIIAGDGAATSLRLAFFSDGTPIVIWATGTNLKAAIRNGPMTGTSKGWSAGVIDTGIAPRAVDISINPLNQVAVAFLTDTAVSGRPKFLYCDAPCSSPSHFQTMSTNPYIENTNVVAAETNIGVAWCKVSPTTYFPAAAYAVTGSTHFSMCMNTLNNCLNGASWTNGAVVATGNTSTRLLIDATTVGDVPKVVSLGAAGVVPYRMGTSPCSSGVAAFTAGSAMGTATTGSQWMNFLKDASGKFHLMANESTTSVRYFNSTSTDPVLGWNAPGIVDTVTLPAASQGGADIDQTTSAIYVSYSQNSLPFDFKLARVNDFTQAASAATFTRFTPDLSGDMQIANVGAQLKQIAMATNAAKKPGIAYVDFSVGGAASAKLKFALNTSDGEVSHWTSFLVPGTLNPQFPSLVFDETSRPWIGYFDAALNRFFLTTNSLTDGSGTWSTYEFPVTPAGAPLALPAANNTAVALSTAAGVTNPVMFAIDTNAGSKGIRSAVLNKLTRSWNAPKVIDGLTTGALGAANLSADADSNGHVVVAYQDLTAARVKYSYSADAVTWTPANSISGVSQGQGVAIKLNPSTGKPAVSYFDQTNNAVYFNSCSGTPAACASGGWSPQQIEGAAGVSSLAASSAQLIASSVNFDASGSAFIFYPRGQLNDGNLVFSSNSSGAFNSSVAANGANANLPGSPALNFGIAGWGVAATSNNLGNFTAAYIGPGNRLYSSTCQEK